MPAEKLDSELLRTFLTVADTGSFSRGADRIFRSQSAASLQIKRLEELLGQKVFERHARGVALTPVGERLRPVAQRVVDLLDVTIGELRSDVLEGLIRIGIPGEYGETILPDVIARFSRFNSRVELEVRCSFSADFPAALSRDELDLAVYTAETLNPRSHVLKQERTLWVGSRHYPVHERDPLPVALFERSCWWRDRALEALEATGRRFRVVYTSESSVGVTAAIAAGTAVGVLAESAIRDGLRALSPAESFPQLPDSILVLALNRNVKSPAVNAMARTIVDAFDKGNR